MAICSRCEGEFVRTFDDGLCGFCQITLAKNMQVTGTVPAMRGRVDVVNPYRDTMRAIEYMAQHSKKAKPEELKRWARQARQGLADRNYKYSPESNQQSAFGGVTASQQAEARKAEGELKNLWDKARYERTVLKKKPVNDTQARNYQVVDRWEKAGT